MDTNTDPKPEPTIREHIGTMLERLAGLKPEPFERMPGETDEQYSRRVNPTASSGAAALIERAKEIEPELDAPPQENDP